MITLFSPPHSRNSRRPAFDRLEDRTQPGQIFDLGFGTPAGLALPGSNLEVELGSLPIFDSPTSAQGATSHDSPATNLDLDFNYLLGPLPDEDGASADSSPDENPATTGVELPPARHFGDIVPWTPPVEGSRLAAPAAYSSDSGGGNCGIPPGTPAPGSTVVQAANTRYAITGDSEVILTDKSALGDEWALKAIVGDTAPTTEVYTNAKAWYHVEFWTLFYPDANLRNIYLSGHGTVGGVQASIEDLIGDNLTVATGNNIHRKLAPGGKVILFACGVGTFPETERIADRIGVPVIANTGDVGWGNFGYGQWVQFNPE